MKRLVTFLITYPIYQLPVDDGLAFHLLLRHSTTFLKQVVSGQTDKIFTGLYATLLTDILFNK